MMLHHTQSRHNNDTVNNSSGQVPSSAIRDVSDWLIHQGLGEYDSESLFQQLCDRIHRAGVPLLRGHLTVRTLHPLVSSVDFTWWRDQGVAIAQREHESKQSQVWRGSPLYALVEQRRTEMRYRLDDPAIIGSFPVFEEFSARRGKDYLCCLVPFGELESALSRHDGIIVSWLTDHSDGFSIQHLNDLRYLQTTIALVAKLSKRENTATNVVAAYLGTDAGERVLNGQIRLGDVDYIHAVIWYSDLRNSTSMAERMKVAEFFTALNAYFACTAGAVLDGHGEVLRFIGDAVLAVFPVQEDGSAAARRALSAARDAYGRLARANAQRQAEGLEMIDFGLGLHIGEVLYGNIGIPERIEFSVIGRAANEVCRLQDLCKEVGRSVVVSSEFAAALDDESWISLGEFALKGIGAAREVFTPAEF